MHILKKQGTLRATSRITTRLQRAPHHHCRQHHRHHHLFPGSLHQHKYHQHQMHYSQGLFILGSFLVSTYIISFQRCTRPRNWESSEQQRQQHVGQHTDDDTPCWKYVYIGPGGESLLDKRNMQYDFVRCSYSAYIYIYTYDCHNNGNNNNADMVVSLLFLLNACELKRLM